MAKAREKGEIDMSNQNSNTATIDDKIKRYVIIVGVVAVAFFASYQFATAAGGGSDVADSGYVTQGNYTPAAYDTAADSGAGGCSCCGDSGSGETIEGAATFDDDGVQRISVDASNGYDPNVIVLASGVPTEITFSEGYGCMAQVMSAELGVYEDLQSGPRTVTLEPLEPGTYGFSCGMEMIFGQIVVEERI